MQNRTEGVRPLAFLLSEGEGNLSRDVVTIPAGTGKVEAGTVLGQITLSEAYVPSPAGVVAGKEGAETARAICAYNTDATDADAEVVVINDIAEVKAPMLIFDASVNDATKQAVKLEQLRAVHIKAR